MPSQQQKSANQGSERNVKFGANHILVTLRWGDGRSPGHENVGRWFLIDAITGPVKSRKSCVSRKMFEIELKFSELLKRVVFRCL